MPEYGVGKLGFDGENMAGIIGDFEFTAVWGGVLYKKLSDFSRISDWEIRTIIEFIEYEKKYGRIVKIYGIGLKKYIG